MSIKANIPSYLQHLTNEMEVAEVRGTTVGECLEHLVKQFPGIEKLLFAENDKLHGYVALYVNRDDSYPEELAKPVKDGDEISIEFSAGCCC